MSLSPSVRIYSGNFKPPRVFFGENGLGKTSVVEAIRWCLFGLASRRGGTIKNQFYGGACIVELTLQAPDGIWSFQRRLSQSGGIGPSTIRDPS